MIDFKDYIKDLQSEDINNITEHSKRSALEILLKQFADKCQNGNNLIKILHEPKRKDNYGSPDFKVYTNSSIIGYIENKKITENLDKILKTDQIKKYRELSQNILLTNYIEYIWIKGDTIQRETLCYQSDLENKKFKLDTDKCVKVEKLISFFFSQAPQQIANPKELALALATRCKNLKDYLLDELIRQQTEQEQGRLFGLYETFKLNIFHELELTEFADAFAQMLSYGLFLAKLNADTKTINLRNAKDYIPKSFQLIRELVSFLDELDNDQYKETKWIIDETISIMNNIELVELKRQLSFTKRIKDSDNFETDPYIYFYETFLTAYDSKLRKAKGVYYTPPQVVNFITRALNDILINIFDIPDGFAGRNNVTVLDFATGTGTFLLDVIKQTLETIPPDSKAKRDMVIKEHILKNFYGFEYLIAPYTIAHLKLSQYLQEQGYIFADNERLQIFLTNTLEPVSAQLNYLLPQLSKEGEKAQKVKEQPVLVITGNPPYSYVSKNNGDWITNLLKGNDILAKGGKQSIANYYMIDDERLIERNSQGLNDDYVKFIRFAQYKMEQVEQGAIGIITSHSFLDNPTYRGMRQSLIKTFDQLYFIDLHGNSDKKETTPEGGKDENVFDIKAGVCISIFIKKKGLSKSINYIDFWGLREEKYLQCLSSQFGEIDWQTIMPASPFYLFKPQNADLKKQYENFYSVKDIFFLSNECVKTNRDYFLVSFTQEELIKRANDFINDNIDDITLSNKYHFEDGSYWNTKREREKAKQDKEFLDKINPYSYRPLDNRFILYKSNLIEIGRGGASKKVMRNMLFSNIGIVLTRFAFKKQLPYSYNFIVNAVTDVNYIQSPGSAQLAPLYLYQKDSGFFANSNDPNIVTKSENFTKEFRKFINKKYDITYSPEQILGYIYSILYSSFYRNKYAEFLKGDFPRIPFTEDKEIFEKLSTLGWDLIQKHLLNPIPNDAEYNNLGIYKGDGNNVVVKPDYRTVTIDGCVKGSLYINKEQYFDNIPENIYKFYIGGYQVLDKYLKDRKTRKLSLDEIENVESIVKVLAFTEKQMEQINNLTMDWI